MSNYRRAPLKLVRSVGPLPTLTRKTPKKRWKSPGQHGRDINERRALRDKSAYGLRLTEKQKLRYNYGIGERQLVRYVSRAKKSGASTGDTLLSLLEMRLDNTVFRLGLTPTIVAARQLVVHGHIRVNDRKLTRPSYSCTPSDRISIKPVAKSRQLVQAAKRSRRVGRGSGRNASLPKHLSFDPLTLTGTVNQTIRREDVKLKKINPLLVVEYYSGM